MLAGNEHKPGAQVRPNAQKSEARNQKSEVGSLKSEFANPHSAIRNPQSTGPIPRSPSGIPHSEPSIPRSAFPVPHSRLPISLVEAEVLGLFVQLARALGQPRSYAEIYGLIFISPRPLTMEDLIARLGISRGSASQGLKFLRDLGALRIVYGPGDRSIHYEAVAQLRLLVTRLLQTQVFPQLDSSRDRLEAIARLAKDLPPAERAHVNARIHILRVWTKRTRRFGPLFVKLLGA